MNKLAFCVVGEPVPKGRHRSRVIVPKGGGAPFAQEYPDPKTKAYEDKLAWCAKAAMSKDRWAPADTSRFRLLIRVYTTHDLKRGDWDNYAKCVDGLNGIVWRDDKLVTEAAVIVRQDRERPRMEIEVEEIAAA